MSSILVMYSLRRAVHELSSDTRPKFKTMRASLYEDVSADGSRFLLPTVRGPLTSYLVVMQGWESFLKRK